MTTYLIVLQISGKCYLQLTAELGISAYDSLEEAKSEFRSFYDKITSSTYSWHISSGYGLLQISPHIIKSPREDEDAEWVKEYALSDLPSRIKGGITHVPNPVLEVNADILKLSVLDVAKDVIGSLNKES